MLEKTFKFDKIIRDKSYDDMVKNGAKVSIYKIKNQAHLAECFKKKLLEEIDEVIEADSKDNLVEELADCFEVLRGFASALNISCNDIETVRKQKYQKKGGFEKAIMVESVTVSANYTPLDFYKYFTSYCENKPEKYPQIAKTTTE